MGEGNVRKPDQFSKVRVHWLAALCAAAVGCADEAALPTSTAEQGVVNTPPPVDLRLALHAKTSLTIGPNTYVNGDVGVSGASGTLLFDAYSNQSYYGRALANTITVRVGANAGVVHGNIITVDGSARQRILGLDPAALPPVPPATAAVPGSTNVSIGVNQLRQLCPGQYGTISVGRGATLNLNGGVYQVSRLTLADGATLVPSEPVVILVATTMTLGQNATVEPYEPVVRPMTAGDIRIEVGGAATFGDYARVRAHLLVPNGKLAIGASVNFTGAAWAKTISVLSGGITSEDDFSLTAPEVPPPCNDGNSCTADQCNGGGTAFGTCSNTPVPSGSSCEDGNSCNGAETCDSGGTCLPGRNADAGTSCADGDLCNGDETCNGGGTCLAGAPPTVDDGNSCTADACDSATGVSHEDEPDGTSCSILGVCDSGTCSVQGTVFSADFTTYGSVTQQCEQWNSFRSSLTKASYSAVKMAGTFDPFGVTCTDSAAATRICQALRSGSYASVVCDGRQWTANSCGSELAVDRNYCYCGTSRGTVRPCESYYWGGMNTSSCYAPDQNLTVVCE
jgi:hypothetical protein